MTKLPKYKAPFSRDSLMHYAREGYTGDSVEWRENIPFEATLTIQRMTSGYSAKYTIWTDEQGNSYPMFVADIVELVKEAPIQSGTVTGKWIVRKRGQNYGIKFYKE